MTDSENILNRNTPTTANRAYNKQLQIYLREMSYVYEGINPVIPDGYPGPGTDAAVRAYQEAVGLEITGIADPVTWEMLQKDYQNSINSKNGAKLFSAYPSHDAVFESGDFHPCIFCVQHAFMTLSENFSNFETPEFNGTIDAITENNIRIFRSLALLSEGSHLDIEVWNMLSEIHGIIS